MAAKFVDNEIPTLTVFLNSVFTGFLTVSVFATPVFAGFTGVPTLSFVTRFPVTNVTPVLKIVLTLTDVFDVVVCVNVVFVLMWYSNLVCIVLGFMVLASLFKFASILGSNVTLVLKIVLTPTDAFDIVLGLMVLAS